MKLKPLHDWAVIIPAEAATMTAGGLYIPDSAKEKPEEGIVEAIGPGAFEQEKRKKKKDESKERKFVPTVVKSGDRVLYERWAGKTVMIGNEERIVVRERDILGLVDRPVQIPAATTHQASTAIAERQAPLPPKKLEKASAGPGLKATKKPAAKKSAPKAAKKKAAKPSAKKSASKPSKPKSKKTGKKK